MVIAVIKEAARFINNNLCVLFVPLINTCIGLAIFVMWFVGVVFLYTTGTITKNSSGYPWSDVIWNDYSKGMWYFNMFFILWLLAFIVSLNVFVIASAAVVWYYQQGPSNNDQEGLQKTTKNPCYTGFCWALGWHMGSIAFGSFILAVIWTIQIVM